VIKKSYLLIGNQCHFKGEWCLIYPKGWAIYARTS